MPELRKDPIVGRWVIIANERARRPGNFVDYDQDFEPNIECSFCDHQLDVIYRVKDEPIDEDGLDWRVCVIPSLSPILKENCSPDRREKGLYEVVQGCGVDEVVIETPDHIANMADLGVDQIEEVIKTYVVRFKELQKNPKYTYGLVYKNYGYMAGGKRVGHTCSHVVATPVNPLRIKDKLHGAKKYFRERDKCLYCDLISQEEEFKKRIITQNDDFVALTPFAARFLFEVMIVPKKHHCDFHKGVKACEHSLAEILKDLLVRFKIGLDDPPYNYMIHTAPFRRESGESARFKTIEKDYHWHIELMPRLTRIAGFEKGSGFYICPIPPEDMAQYLREVELDG